MLWVTGRAVRVFWQAKARAKEVKEVDSRYLASSLTEIYEV
jgi:hypothetical protein